MSLVPTLFGHPFYDTSLRPSRLMDQWFGMGLEPEDLLSPFNTEMRAMMRPGYFRPWRSTSGQNDVGSTVSLSDNKFQVNLDVQQFKPEEITVKVTGNNEITIEGKHEEKQDDHGYISRHFVRRYLVPEGHNMDKLESKLSSDGVLSIVAPRDRLDEKQHRNISIQKTGKPAVEEKKKN